MKKNKHKLIIVLGMHRSGTSVITRALLALGVDVGHNLMPAIQGNNDKGFWEDLDIVSLNEEMLFTLSCSWHYLLPISSDDVRKLSEQGFLSRALNLLREKIFFSEIFGLKDPRLVKLLPFWKKVFAQLDADVYYIITLRNPLSVSRSLLKRDGFPLEKGHLMWLDHMVSSLEQTTNEKRIIVNYDLLMENPEKVVLQLAEQLHLGVDVDQLQEFKNEFLDSKLRHTVFVLDDLFNNSSVPPVMYQIYSELLKAQLDENQLKNSAFLKKVDEWKESITSQKQSWDLVNYLTAQYDRSTSQLAERDIQLAEKDAQLAEKDAQLAEKDAQLADIYSSKGWRLVLWLRRVRLWIAPPGSVRAKIGRTILSTTVKMIKKL